MLGIMRWCLLLLLVPAEEVETIEARPETVEGVRAFYLSKMFCEFEEDVKGWKDRKGLNTQMKDI